MMKRFALTWLLVLIFAVRLLAQNTGVATYNVRTYGAKGDGTTDDTAAIARAVAAAVAYEAANDTTVMVLFPKGTYIVQDPTTASTYTTTSDGGIIIPSSAENIILSGPEATVKVGSNGITTSTIRCFADNCIIEGFTIDPNGDAAPRDNLASVPTPLVPDDYHTKDNSGIELNGCENSVIRDCAVLDGDKTIFSYNTGTVSYDHTGGSSERLVTLSGGSWPAWLDTDCALTIAGVRYAIASVNSSTVLQLGADSSTKAANNPGSDVGSTSNWAVTGYQANSGGEDLFLIVNGVRCRIEGCLAIDGAWTSYRVSGDNNSVIDCTAVNFRGNGLRIVSGTSVYVRGFKAYSTRCDERSHIIADAGSTNGDQRMELVFIEDCELYGNPDGDFGGACSVLKLAAAHQVHVKNCKVVAGTATNNVAVRLEDNLRYVFLEDCYISPQIQFTPASGTGAIYQGDLTAHAAGAAHPVSGNYVRYTVSGTPSSAIEDRELHVRGSGVDQYNGPQQILDRGAGYIETDRLYVAGTIGSGAHGQTACDTFKMRDCVVDGLVATETIPTTTAYNYMIEDCNAYNVDIEQCVFNQVSEINFQRGCINTDYITENGWSMFRFVRNKVTFYSTATCRVHRGDNSATTEIHTSGKTIFYDNEKHNKSSGTVYWSDETTTDRDILFNTNGENARAFRYTTYPTSASVTFAVGDIVWNTEPSGTSPICWICTTAGSPGTWQPIGLDYTLQSTVVDAGSVSTSETNLISYTLPANTLNSEGESLEIEAGFSFANNTNAKRVKMYFGSAAFYDSGSSAHQDGGMVLRAVVTRDTSSVAKVGYMVTSSGSNTPFAIATGDATNASADMTATITIKGTGQGTSDNDVVMEYLRVRKVSAP